MFGRAMLSNWSRRTLGPYQVSDFVSNLCVQEVSEI